MNCKQLRELLTRQPVRTPAPAALAHLQRCPACARFAQRFQLVAEVLGEHHAGAEPDVGFAGRVVAALPTSSSDLLGWAAIRLLPATLALALVLTAWALAATPSPTSLLEHSLEGDLWSWIMSSPGGRS